MLVLKTIHFKDGTKKHKNELYHFQWGFGRTMFMALMSAFNNVSSFKVGPDYIDPGFH